jgi:DNA-binding MarR family transcriptional regulator
MRMKAKTSASGAGRSSSAASSPRGRRQRDLQRNLHILSAVVRRVLEQDPVESLPDSPITPEQLKLLRFVVLKRGAKVGEVASGLGITAASASLALDRLQALGFIERRKRSRDRRSVQVFATRSGRALVARVRRIVDAKLSRAMGRMGVEDTKDFTELAAKVTRILMEGQDYFGEVCMQCGVDSSASCVIHELFETCPYSG